MTGIITAMTQEGEKLIENADINERVTIGFQTYYIGTVANQDVVISVCGVGKVFAAICTQTMIVKFGCDHILNVGVAGSLDNNIDINDVVFAENVVQYDMDTSALGDPKGMISGINIIEIPCDNSQLELVRKSAKAVGLSLKKGTIATGDKFFKDIKSREKIAQRFNAKAGEMEGGAVGQTAFSSGIPFNVVRIISDKAGENSANEYSENCQSSANLLAKVILKYFEMKQAG